MQRGHYLQRSSLPWIIYGWSSVPLCQHTGCNFFVSSTLPENVLFPLTIKGIVFSEDISAKLVLKYTAIQLFTTSSSVVADQSTLVQATHSAYQRSEAGIAVLLFVLPQPRSIAGFSSAVTRNQAPDAFNSSQTTVPAHTSPGHFNTQSLGKYT